MQPTDPVPAETPDAHIVASLAHAERRRAMLERLAEFGMEMAGEIKERMINSPYHPEPRHDPARAFAAVSRAVRLTLALEARIDADGLAMRNGTFAPTTAKTASDSCLSAPVFGSVSNEHSRDTRLKVHDAVCEAINREIGDVERADVALDRVRESLIEREDYDEYLDRPWRQCVEIICADLGLAPDWSQWSDEAGFAKSETGPGHGRPPLGFHKSAEAEDRRRAPPSTAERLAASWWSDLGRSFAR